MTGSLLPRFYLTTCLRRDACGVFPRDEYIFDCEHDPSWCAQETVERRALLSFLDQHLISNTFADFARRWRAKGDYHFTLEQSLECGAGWPGWAPAYEEEDDCHYGYRRDGETAEQAIQDLIDTNGNDEEDIGGRRADWTADRIWMRPVRGVEAEEMFCGEYNTGWAACGDDEIDALPFWEVRLK